MSLTTWVALAMLSAIPSRVDADPPERYREEDVVVREEKPRGLPAAGEADVVLEGDALRARSESDLGKSLVSVPGIHATSRAAGSSRPVLRGFQGDRARVLQGGMDTADASAGRQDHAVALDAGASESIEILRGTTALLYGTNTVGGIVNVGDAAIPDRVPSRSVGGTVLLGRGANASEASHGLSLDGGVGQLVAWRASLLHRQAEDLRAAGSVALRNSDLEGDQSAFGISRIFGRGFVGVAHRSSETEYGIPTARTVRIGMGRRRFDLAGEWPRDRTISGFEAHVARTEYEHDELLAADGLTTRYRQRTVEARGAARHRWSRGSGVVGMRYAARDLDVTGDQAYIAPNRTRERAVFAMEELAVDRVTIRLATRWEQREVRASGPVPSRRSFRGLSSAVEAIWRPRADWRAGLTISRTSRLPTVEELHVRGPHLAAFRFEVGDPAAGAERGSAVELRLSGGVGRVRGRLAAFVNHIDDYLYFTPTGNTVQVGGEEVPEVRLLQRDARYRGAEVLLEVALLRNPAAVQLELKADRVVAEMESFSPSVPEDLPRIPPARFAVGLRYERGSFWSTVESVRASEQDRVALFETPTPGSSMLGGAVGYRRQVGSVVHDVRLRISNWTDREARNHVSTLKDIVPDPGREVTVRYRLLF